MNIKSNKGNWRCLIDEVQKDLNIKKIFINLLERKRDKEIETPELIGGDVTLFRPYLGYYLLAQYMCMCMGL